MLDAARSKARRSKLYLSVPFGYVWHREAGLGLDPDLRMQEVIRLIFARFHELGSARQVLLPVTADQIHLPQPSDEGRGTSFTWLPTRYRDVIAVLKNHSMQALILTERVRSVSPLSTGVPRGFTGRASRQELGKFSSRTTTRATSVGRSKSATRSSWRSAPMAARRRHEVRLGRQGVTVGDHNVRAVWTTTECRLYRQPAKSAGLSLGQAQPDDMPAPVHDLWRPSVEGAVARALLRGRTAGDRGRVRGRANTPGTTGGSAPDPRSGTAAGLLRSRSCRALLCGLRS